MELPKFLEHLPVYRGFPVPYIAFYVDGKPDFRINDQMKQLRCYEDRLCAICGKVMFEFWFIGGPQSMQSGMFTDGPMHRACALFAIGTCPFLRGVRTEHSYRPVPASVAHKIVRNEEVPTVRPDKMALRRAKKFVLGTLQEQHLVYQVQKWSGRPQWFEKEVVHEVELKPIREERTKLREQATRADCNRSSE